jgi:hypothetical protein
MSRVIEPEQEKPLGQVMHVDAFPSIRLLGLMDPTFDSFLGRDSIHKVPQNGTTQNKSQDPSYLEQKISILGSRRG